MARKTRSAGGFTGAYFSWRERDCGVSVTAKNGWFRIIFFKTRRLESLNMHVAANQKKSVRRLLKSGGVGWFFILSLIIPAPAATVAFTNLLAQGDVFGAHSNLAAALKIYSQAEASAAGNSADLCVLTKHFCDLMFVAGSPGEQKILAARALACAQRAAKADPQNATAHICVAICCAKNFPFADNQAKVADSRLIKSEAEKAIALDPKQDVAYYLLGRWNYGVANMSFVYKALIKIAYGGLPAASNAEAIRNLKQAILLNPNRIIHHAELAKVYETTGQEKSARQELEKCRALKPLDRDDADAQKEAIKALSD
jgi:tetratricopeptide (TPR) repeat protein